MPGSRLDKCSSKRFLSLMYTLELNGSRVRKKVVGTTNASEDGRLRGIGPDRQRVRIERKRIERKVGGEKAIFWLFVLFSTPPKKTVPLFFSTTPHKKIPFQTVDK